MKKMTLLSASLLLFLSANAEQMQFVTTLSAPVGNFAHLDAADSTHVTSAPILNFCNTRSNVGNIVIKGANAYIRQVNMQNGSSLGSTNTPEYRLSEKLTVENGGAVTAGRLMADKVTFGDTNYHKSNVTSTLYGNDITVKGGKTDNMEISSTAKINKSAQNAANLGQELWWDNQYGSDYDASGNKKANGTTYTSFLLKSKSVTRPADDCPAGRIKDLISDECVCAAEVNGTEEYTNCEGDRSEECLVLYRNQWVKQQVDVPHSWNSETCTCEFKCIFFRCERLDRMQQYHENNYSSVSAAQDACKKGDKNAEYYVGAGLASNPLEVAWTNHWYCTDIYSPCEVNKDSGYNPCTCLSY